MTFTSPPAQPLPLGGVFSQVKLTGPELSKLRAVQSKIAAIWEVASDYRPSRANHRGEVAPTKSRTDLDAAVEALRTDPTPEAAERYFSAVIRDREVQAVGPTVANACQVAVEQANRGLADIVRAVGVRAAAALEKAAKDRVSSVKTSNLVLDAGNEAAEFEARIQATREALERELAEGLENPLAFLEGRGLISDIEPEAAPVKSKDSGDNLTGAILADIEKI